MVQNGSATKTVHAFLIQSSSHMSEQGAGVEVVCQYWIAVHSFAECLYA